LEEDHAAATVSFPLPFPLPSPFPEIGSNCFQLLWNWFKLMLDPLLYPALLWNWWFRVHLNACSMLDPLLLCPSILWFIKKWWFWVHTYFNVRLFETLIRLCIEYVPCIQPGIPCLSSAKLKLIRPINSVLFFLVLLADNICSDRGSMQSIICYYHPKLPFKDSNWLTLSQAVCKIMTCLCHSIRLWP
jgi:hypothetical protein